MPGPAAIINLSSLMSCSLPLQIDGYSFKADPILMKDVGRVGTRIECQGEGFVMSDSTADFQTAIEALETYCFVEGQNFIIHGPQNSILQQVFAADCVENGPHLGFEIMNEGMGPLYARVRFTLSAITIGDVVYANYKLRIATATDGLQRVTQTGVLVGSGANALFTSSTLPAFEAAYSPPEWVLSHEIENPYGGAYSQTDLVTRYTINAEQLAGDLPDVSGVVDGEVTYRSTRDEQQRVTDVWEFECNLTPSTSYSGVVSSLMTIATSNESDNAQLTTQSASIQMLHHLRVRASFTFLSSGDNNLLLNYDRTVRVATADPAYTEFTYPGTDPIAVQKPTVFARISDSGTAMGLGRFIQVPDPILETFEQQPVYTFTDVSNVEKRTSWQREMIDVDGTLSSDLSTLVSEIARPSDPGTY